ncbi:hypothetical protein THERU_06430 [Thermocrinis ruber]|uniref:Uncharacterized protein n=1 Tax=Thermocrinis ruber TaxID=75906 RepID=W0DJ31_9AQUI|nr:hypothetical protein THERU_06430 [Thermocrinis ruber]
MAKPLFKVEFFNFSPKGVLIQAFYLKSKFVRICYFLNSSFRFF